MGKITVEPVPLLGDNYGWLFFDEKSRSCAVIDPSTAGPIIERVQELGLDVGWILATHHHWDHVGGVEELVGTLGEVEVLCSQIDHARVPCVTQTLSDGEGIMVAGTAVQCLAVPGHTRGAIAYHVESARAVFTGDTLFLAGCGRLFEGTPADMHASLTRLAGLPDDTQVCCGHEYTEKNLRFAATVDPDNRAVQERIAEVGGRRAEGQPSVPAPLSIERATNPFLRASEPVLCELAERRDPVEVFAELRRRRDRF